MDKKTLVFDLDGTLVYTDTESYFFKSGRKKDYEFAEIPGFVRPGAKELLNELEDDFDLALFTAGTQDYAESILDQTSMRKNFKIIKHREDLKREPISEDFPLKEIQKNVFKIENDPKKVLLIEDTPLFCVSRRENCLIIPDFTGHPDEVLHELKRCLKPLKNESDIREGIKKHCSKFLWRPRKSLLG